VSSNGIDRNKTPLAHLPPIAGPLGIAGALTLVLVLGLSRIGCANHHTPAGYEGYIKSEPLFAGAEFLGIQQDAPASTGWVWRQRVTNIDFRPRTYSEDMQILTKNQLTLRFRAHARIQLRAGAIKRVVEEYGGENWYAQNVKELFQGAVRAQLAEMEPFEVKRKMRQIGENVKAEMQGKFAESPIEFLTVDIGNIEYPEVVVKSVVRKFVTYQENQRKNIELTIAQKQIEIGVAEAQGISDAQKVIRTTLDPIFLQFEALRAIEQLAGSTNTTFLVTPYSKGGTSPVIMNLGQ